MASQTNSAGTAGDFVEFTSAEKLLWMKFSKAYAQDLVPGQQTFAIVGLGAGAAVYAFLLVRVAKPLINPGRGKTFEEAEMIMEAKAMQAEEMAASGYVAPSGLSGFILSIPELAWKWLPRVGKYGPPLYWIVTGTLEETQETMNALTKKYGTLEKAMASEEFRQMITSGKAFTQGLAEGLFDTVVTPAMAATQVGFDTAYEAADSLYHENKTNLTEGEKMAAELRKDPHYASMIQKIVANPKSAGWLIIAAREGSIDKGVRLDALLLKGAYDVMMTTPEKGDLRQIGPRQILERLRVPEANSVPDIEDPAFTWKRIYDGGESQGPSAAPPPVLAKPKTHKVQQH